MMGTTLSIIAFLQSHWDLIAVLLPSSVAIAKLTKWGKGHAAQTQTAQQVIDILTGTIDQLNAKNVKSAVLVKEQTVMTVDAQKALKDSLDRIAQK
jgi:hypothetical protein